MADATPTDTLHCSACAGDLEGAALMTCLHVLCRNCAPSGSPYTTSGSVRRGSDVTSVRRGPDAAVRRGSEGGAAVNPCPVCSRAATPAPRKGPPAATSSSVTSLEALRLAPRVAAKPCASVQELRRVARQGGGPTPDNDDNDSSDDDDDDDEGGGGEEREGSGAGEGEESESSPLAFPCPQHSHRVAEQFCLSCRQLACAKCLASSHKKCDLHLVSCAEAVASQRASLNSLHSKLAEKVIATQRGVERERSALKNLEERRASLIGQITAQKEALVRLLVAKEERLIREVNEALDKVKDAAEVRMDREQHVARATEGQLSVLEAVMSVKGEPEILSLLPSLHARLDAELGDSPTADTSSNLVFHVNKTLAEDVAKSDLGHVALADDPHKGDNGRKKASQSDLRLTLMTSFHARMPEDTCDPLLTDLVLLPNGDVILTDRDNKCVKKFNATGHLLTRVQIPEVPSRLALVSHGKAAISVMNRKVLFFLSLLGTVRILSAVKVRKHYCFLAAAGHGFGQGQAQGQGQTPGNGQGHAKGQAATHPPGPGNGQGHAKGQAAPHPPPPGPAGNGQGHAKGQGPGECLLLAATNMCDVIDVITESGVLLRSLYTHKSSKGTNISRPLYLAVPQPQPRDPLRETAALVVDSGRRVLFGLTSAGETTFTFRPKDEDALECPLGVGVVAAAGAGPGPGAGAGAGAGMMILLADRDKHRVMLVGGQGSLLGNVLTEKEGLHKPCALYTAVAGRLALTQVDGWVKVYRVE